MSGHTPGPWWLEVGVNTGWFTLRGTKGPNDVVLAQRPPWPDHAAESAANARLIAAAPDLLEALRGILPLAEAYLMKAPTHSDNAKLEDARAAIAKAEGK